ncbi:endothelin-converting enzyme 2 [Drosophila tropicalis]|uniref:endothelin-converting enzyme 2 n=1 Tax=Drosophila tropicalis TaxID=46794 RepID=UPI0035AC0E24
MMLRRIEPCLVLLLVASFVQGIPVKDDLSTDFAKQIIRQSKVADIKAMLNTNIRPCDDFYSYSCGNWHRQNPAQLLSNIMTDTFQLIAKGFDRRLKNLLESTDAKKSELEGKLQRFYQSCRMVHRDDVHYKLALENVYREYGELPVLAGDQWNETEFVWWRTAGEIQHKYGKQIILAVDIMRDIKNNTENKVYVGPPDFLRISNSGILNVLEEAGTTNDMKQYLGLTSKQARETSQKHRKLEHDLMAGSSVVEGRSLEDELTLYSLIELQDKYEPHINFTEFFGLVLGPQNVPQVVYIYNEEYLDHTFDTLQATPKSTQANYVLWELLQEYLLDADAAQLPKWCIEKTKKYFSKLVDQVVYARYRSPETEAEVFRVWEQIQAVFRQQLAGDKLDWISNSTRQMAIEKLDHMKLYINNYDAENFESFYEGVTIDRLNFVANVQQLRAAQANNTFVKLHGAPTSLEASEILSFTPAYNILENNISIPVALLQPRYFWNVEYPQAFTYATLGYLLAHEMTHGFDDDGRNYDANGNLAAWWDYKSRYEFEERRKCFQAQYHAYKYGGTKLPETVLQSENIADNAGVKLAYAAYQRWFEQQTEATQQQETLSGLNMTGNQLFFVAFAQLWCEDVQSLFKSSVASGDNHAPGMYRVIGSLSNFQEFSWVFNCSQSAPMDPEYKCAIY